MQQSEYFRLKVEPKLKAASSAAEMLEVLNKHYDLTVPLGPITRLAFAQGLRSAVTMVAPPIKNKTKWL